MMVLKNCLNCVQSDSLSLKTLKSCLQDLSAESDALVRGIKKLWSCPRPQWLRRWWCLYFVYSVEHIWQIGTVRACPWIHWGMHASGNSAIKFVRLSSCSYRRIGETYLFIIMLAKQCSIITSHHSPRLFFVAFCWRQLSMIITFIVVKCSVMDNFAVPWKRPYNGKTKTMCPINVKVHTTH